MVLTKTTQMNLGKKVRECCQTNMLSKDQEPLYKVVPLHWFTINKPTGIFLIILLELLTLPRTKKCE
jgi:hypothetical protein